MNPNQVVLSVVVNGKLTEVEGNLNAPLKTLIPKALHQTNNSGRPPEDWRLSDEAGAILDLDKKIGDYHFPQGIKLFLNLEVGVGGRY